ncbi:MAG TPA: PHP domain-containing protein [Thermoanaerobaculia bacterium]
MLLADLHIHTTWSDGRLSIPEVVDLFGRSGHDVIAITDHIVNSDNVIGKVTHRFGLTLTKDNFDAYRAEVDAEAKRARDEYGMLVIAGAELTQNRMRRASSAHVLALDIDDFISAEGSVEEMLVRANDSGAVVVACHPHEQSEWFANTFYLWNRRNEVAQAIHLWELACRWDLFPPVARHRMPFVGNSDFHDRAHLYAWKTLLPCERNVADVVRTLKRGSGLAVTRLEPSPHEVMSCSSSRSLLQYSLA